MKIGIEKEGGEGRRGSYTRVAQDIERKLGVSLGKGKFKKNWAYCGGGVKHSAHFLYVIRRSPPRVK